MRYHILACDYDGTLAEEGQVHSDTLAAVERLLSTGRQLVLVTGRELDELQEIFPHLDLFTRVVAENGALLYRPATKEEKILAEAPPPEFAERLRRKGVRMSAGRVIVAAWRPHEIEMLEAIQELGLELQVIFNKDAVMALPSGVNKATGLMAALQELGLTPHETIGIGDAENDHAFLGLCECSVAVANALPALKDRADIVTAGARGAGVIELVGLIVSDDLRRFDDRLQRHHLLLGFEVDGKEVRLPPYGGNVLVAGPSGSGKSTLAAAFLERLVEHAYQFCIIDPEGDYENLQGAVTLGTSERPPTADEVLQLLEVAQQNAVVNLVGLGIADRPPFFRELWPRLEEMRVRLGRPHWLLVDEAHHLLPASWKPGAQLVPRELRRTLFITVHPDQVAPDIVAGIDTVLVIGTTPADTVAQFCGVLHEPPPRVEADALEPGEFLLWDRRSRTGRRAKLVPSTTERRRHTRKYAEGELPPERSFYFRGPEGKLNLRAQNLILFLQLADGVDDETWLFHLRNGDYSTWFRDRIKDEGLAEEAATIERSQTMTPLESRAAIQAVIMRHYTLPAAAPLPMPGTDARPVWDKDQK